MTAYDKTKAWREAQPDLRAIRREEARRWRAKHPETRAAIVARHREKNMDRIRQLDRENQAKRKKADPEAAQRRYREYEERKEAKKVAMAGRPRPDHCELCGVASERICWDHDHVTGEFRGWICDRCNRVLGSVEDSVEILRSMIRYLGER